MKDTAVKGRIHSTETFGTVDGPGIRYVLFLQGCPLRCLYCHNPDTWAPGNASRVLTPEEAAADILRYRNFIRTGGVTLSGGEPLMQPDFCLALIRLLKRQGIATAIDTSGAMPLEAVREAVDESALILLDIKALDPALCRKITGQDNGNALKLLDYCEQTGKDVWIRHVVLPGYTDDPFQWEKMAAYLSGFSCIKRVELLPFHKMGENKWQSLKMPYTLGNVQPPTGEQMEQAQGIFRGKGLEVR